MIKRIKKYFCVLLVLLLVLPNCTAFAGILVHEENVSYLDDINENVINNKIECQATLDDNFRDDSVIVLLKKDAIPVCRLARKVNK